MYPLSARDVAISTRRKKKGEGLSYMKDMYIREVGRLTDITLLKKVTERRIAFLAFMLKRVSRCPFLCGFSSVICMLAIQHNLIILEYNEGNNRFSSPSLGVFFYIK